MYVQILMLLWKTVPTHFCVHSLSEDFKWRIHLFHLLSIAESSNQSICTNHRMSNPMNEFQPFSSTKHNIWPFMLFCCMMFFCSVVCYGLFWKSNLVSGHLFWCEVLMDQKVWHTRGQTDSPNGLLNVQLRHFYNPKKGDKTRRRGKRKGANHGIWIKIQSNHPGCGGDRMTD